jgi:hypothetical protein
MIPQPVYILFGAAFTVAASYALGRILLSRLRAGLFREEERLFSFLCGSALWSMTVFALCAAGLVYKGTLLGFGTAAMLSAWRLGAWRTRGDALLPLDGRYKRAAIAAVVPFFVLYLVNAMAPEMSPDGSTYHLGLVGRYYRERGFTRITTHMYANLSQGIEMLYLSAYAFGRHSAAPVTHMAFQAALPLAMLTYARRFGFPGAGLAAALLVYLSPVVGVDGTTAYNDVAVAAVIFACFYLLQIWLAAPSMALAAVTGLMAGFAFGSKYTAFVAMPMVGGVMLWKARRLRPALIATGCALLMSAPWLVKNAVTVGNPVSPFFNRIFPNPYVSIAFEDEYKQHMRNYTGLRGYWDIPLEVTVRGHALCGLLGPVFLLAPLALLAWKRPHGKRLLGAALLFGSVYAANIGTRFLIPALPFAALAMGHVITRVPAVAGVLLLAHSLSAWPDIMKQYCAQYAWRLDRVHWRPALRIETEDGFLRRLWPGYAVARMVEDYVPPGERVLSFNQIPESYTSREVLVVYQSAGNAVLGGIQWTPLIPDYQPTRHLVFPITAPPVRRMRIVQTAAHPVDRWTVSELRVYHKGREIPRGPRWRLTASVNPWYIRDAFDNSGVTSWDSFEPLKPGMFIQVDFGAALDVSEVVVESAPVEQNSGVRLEGETAPGVWTVLAEKPRVREAAPPLGMRREAAQEIRQRGVNWLLIADGDFFADDYLKNQKMWGVRLLGNQGGSKLYRIDPLP